jgi:hypothetical protein
MTIDDWIEEYIPMPHPTGKDHGFEVDGKSCLIETYETDILQMLPPENTWSLVDTEGEFVIVAGLRRVNVIGYLYSQEPWETGDEMTEPDHEDLKKNEFLDHEDSEPDQDDWEMDDQDDED